MTNPTITTSAGQAELDEARLLLAGRESYVVDGERAGAPVSVHT